MKTVRTQPVYTSPKEMQKNIKLVNIAFFIMTMFISLINLQHFSNLPLWMNISFIILLASSVTLFGYGLSLSKKYKTWIKAARYLFFYLIVLSLQLFLTSSAMYTIGVRDGLIIEEGNYSQLTLLLYLAGAVLVLILSLFISSPKLRKWKSGKAYVFGSILAVGIIAMMFVALTLIREATFAHPESVKTPYQFFMGSVFTLFPTAVLGMSMLRIKKENRNEE
jgi:cell division protein FtsW (lipid II flippase)